MKLATFLYGVNTRGPLLKTRGARLVRTANYHVFDLLKEHMGGQSIQMEFDQTAGLDVAASVLQVGGSGGAPPSHKVTVSIVNRQESEPLQARLQIKGASTGLPNRGSAIALAGKPEDENTFEQPDRIKPNEITIEGEGKDWEVLCPPYSLTVVTLQASL